MPSLVRGGRAVACPIRTDNFPFTAECIRPDEIISCRDRRARRSRQSVHENKAGTAGADVTTPNLKVVCWAQCVANQGDVVFIAWQRLAVPRTGSEVHLTGRTAGNDVNGLRIMMLLKGLGHLPGGRTLRVEHNRFDS